MNTKLFAAMMVVLIATLAFATRGEPVTFPTATPAPPDPGVVGRADPEPVAPEMAPIEIGMTAEDVLAAWGEPTGRLDAPDAVVWQYAAATVVLEEGRVARWSEVRTGGMDGPRDPMLTPALQLRSQPVTRRTDRFLPERPVSRTVAKNRKRGEYGYSPYSRSARTYRPMSMRRSFHSRNRAQTASNWLYRPGGKDENKTAILRAEERRRGFYRDNDRYRERVRPRSRLRTDLKDRFRQVRDSELRAR